MERRLRVMLIQDEGTRYLEIFAFRAGRDIGYFQLLSPGIELL